MLWFHPNQLHEHRFDFLSSLECSMKWCGIDLNWLKNNSFSPVWNT